MGVRALLSPILNRRSTALWAPLLDTVGRAAYHERSGSHFRTPSGSSRAVFPAHRAGEDAGAAVPRDSAAAGPSRPGRRRRDLRGRAGRLRRFGRRPTPRSPRWSSTPSTRTWPRRLRKAAYRRTPARWTPRWRSCGSNALAQDVVRRQLKLYNDPEFNPAMAPGFYFGLTPAHGADGGAARCPNAGFRVTNTFMRPACGSAGAGRDLRGAGGVQLRIAPEGGDVIDNTDRLDLPRPPAGQQGRRGHPRQHRTGRQP